MKNYNSPKVVEQFEQMEQGILADSGCTTCCPYNEDVYDPGFCASKVLAPKCPRTHTKDANGVVIASTCPKFAAYKASRGF